MTGHFRSAFFVVLAFAALACSTDKGIDGVPVEKPRSRLTSVEATPATFELEPGASVQLSTVARDQFGKPMSGVVEYVSSDEQIAAVSKTGLVTAVSPGAATIGRIVSVGGSFKSASATGKILQPGTATTVVLSFGSKGWTPSVANLPSGGTALWRSGAVSWSGVDVRKVYVMDAAYNAVDSVDITGGAASLKFTKPGTYRYCAGACWDPPDYGVLIVQ